MAHKRRAENIFAIDPVDLGNADGDDRDFHDASVEERAGIFVQHFAVVDVRRDLIGIENDRRRNDRPRPRSASGFIHARDRPRAELMLGSFEFERRLDARIGDLHAPD